ncbi:hypothetical protein Q9295_03245 [Xinfangfangia sp. CPCC 101601]|uniref:5-aminolevulic acid synthase n=1 Tax=Pseudogemmobacter lacusdianii TaxID=3069608 RepID=A0ABU0VUG7_9RHOB|nr:hypothetical protein [Xinfangfangia sp. CPCC 101601]MDQ2065376.1 hypothetical protein [Xinfangfangia sp. CPCC 101601]
MRIFTSAVLACLAATTVFGGAASAQEAAIETATLGKAEVKLHAQPFLTAEEQATLRLVLSNEQALQVFIAPGGSVAKGYAAMAVNPDEGFIREGQPAKSASALAGFASAEEASTAARAACQAAAKSKAPCVLVLEVKAS